MWKRHYLKNKVRYIIKCSYTCGFSVIYETSLQKSGIQSVYIIFELTNLVKFKNIQAKDLFEENGQLGLAI